MIIRDLYQRLEPVQKRIGQVVIYAAQSNGL
jgi:hypothetical protein